MFQRALLVAVIAATPLAAGACQDQVHTRFPPGLEPLEDDSVPVPQGGPTEEILVLLSGGDEHQWVHARGYLFAPPGAVWAATKDPEAVAADCDTTRHLATIGVEPTYEYGFQIHYEVDDLVTVSWDELWRYGTILGTADTPELAMIRYQKVYGSDFITTLEGSVQVKAWPGDPGVTELEFIEHLTAIGGSTDNMRHSMQHRFDILQAAVHDRAWPTCP